MTLGNTMTVLRKFLQSDICCSAAEASRRVDLDVLRVPDTITIVVPTSSSSSYPHTVVSHVLTVNDEVEYTPARDAEIHVLLE